MVHHSSVRRKMSIVKSCRYLALAALMILTSAILHGQKAATGEKLRLRYAKNFEITDFCTHRIATVSIGNDLSTILHQYALVPRDAPLPELPEGIPFIRTPVKKVVVLETIYIGFLESLKQLDTIVGAATADYIINPTIRQRIEQGSVQKIQTAGTLNIERLLLLDPDVIFVSVPSEPTLDISAQLARAGLPAIVTAEYREGHPLARAEWIQFIAAFFDATEEAGFIFDAIAERYESLLEKVDGLQTRPEVFCGAPYSGIWHMARGDSYIAQLIEDAGGNYLWSDVKGASAIPLDFERVFLKAANADIWLNPGFYNSRNSLFAADRRFVKFRAAQENTYNHTRQQAAGIGNPIWESGILRPDDVLADLIKIFHPERMPDHEFVYYEQLR